MYSNEFDFLGIDKIIEEIKKAVEQASLSLDSMNKTIVDAVGDNGTAWRGEAATQFRNSWDQLAINIKDFKKNMNMQIVTIENAVENIKETEE